MFGLFFTATDTGVGKTFVTAAVARVLRRQGRVVRVCKPVATGAARHGDGWLAEDTRLLAEAADDEDYRLITPWAFPVPAAPARRMMVPRGALRRTHFMLRRLSICRPSTCGAGKNVKRSTSS